MAVVHGHEQLGPTLPVSINAFTPLSSIANWPNSSVQYRNDAPGSRFSRVTKKPRKLSIKSLLGFSHLLWKASGSLTFVYRLPFAGSTLRHTCVNSSSGLLYNVLQMAKVSEEEYHFRVVQCNEPLPSKRKRKTRGGSSSMGAEVTKRQPFPFSSSKVSHRYRVLPGAQWSRLQSYRCFLC